MFPWRTIMYPLSQVPIQPVPTEVLKRLVVRAWALSVALAKRGPRLPADSQTGSKQQQIHKPMNYTNT